MCFLNNQKHQPKQGLTGDGDVFLKAGGALIRRELAEGEQLRISSGCLVAFSNGVDYGTYQKNDNNCPFS
jgi:uncharacterized protein (AIM24 family)